MSDDCVYPRTPLCVLTLMDGHYCLMSISFRYDQCNYVHNGGPRGGMADLAWSQAYKSLLGQCAASGVLTEAPTCAGMTTPSGYVVSHDVVPWD